MSTIMRRLLLAAVLVFGITLISFVHPRMAYADTNSFTITDFQADYYPTNEDPQGQMRVVEQIKVAFTDQNHGIYRYIPMVYGKHDLQLRINAITSKTGAPTQYTTSVSNNNKILQIGDPKKTITGDQEYTIDYTVSNFIGFHEGSTELYWNINGPGWNQSFEHVLGVVHLPKGLALSADENAQMQCFAGEQGTTDRNCTIADDGQAVYAETIKPLKPQSVMTMVVGFNTGYFHPETVAEKAQDTWKPFVALVILPLITLVAGLIQWLRRGRDPKGSGVIVAQYDAPDKLNPLEVGTLIDFKVQSGDVSALVISLAIRKVVRIIETRQERMLHGDAVNYSIELLQGDWSQLGADEQTLLKGLFPAAYPGTRVSLDQHDTTLYKTLGTLRKQAEARMTEAGYFVTNPLVYRKQLIGFIAGLLLAVFGLSLALAPSASAGAVIAFLIGLVFWKIMPARTAKGVAAVEHLKGLKRYLQVAETDRIKALQAPHAPAAVPTSEPVRTVELFEKLLPYAMVLGVEKEWAKQFEGLYQQPPEWYSGNAAGFSAGYLIGSLNDGFAASINNSFADSSGSGSSGFSGGSAGGGAGGGGGGGW